MRPIVTIQLCCLIALAMFSGCAQLEMNQIASKIPWSKKEKEQDTTPAKIVAIWNPMMLSKPGKKISRGFGGRVTFFAMTGKKSIEVDGTFMIYVFDEDTPESRGGVPDGKVIFKPEQFATHRTESIFGPSYSVWIPWDELGAKQKKITLIPYFIPTQGAPISGETTTHVLAGPKDKKPSVDNSERNTNQNQQGNYLQTGTEGINPIQRTSFLQSTNAAGSKVQASKQKPGKLRMRTTTFNLPPRSGYSIPRAAIRPRHSNRWKTITPGGAAMSEGRYRPGERLERGTSSLMVEPEQNQASPSTRSSPPTHPAQASPTSQPSYARGSWQRYRGGWPSSRSSKSEPALQQPASKF